MKAEAASLRVGMSLALVGGARSAKLDVSSNKASRAPETLDTVTSEEIAAPPSDARLAPLAVEWPEQ